MSIKTALYDPSTTEFLLLSNGEPDHTAHTLWRLGVLHIYRPGDWPNILVSVDPHGERTDWEFQTPPSSRRPLPPPRPLPAHPWISYDEVTYGLNDAEIVAFDIWRRGQRSGNPCGDSSSGTGRTDQHPTHWDEYDRPVLARLPHPPLQVSLPDLTTPPHQPVPPPSAPPINHNSLPPHIQRLVIDAAINTGATCPITMEPITADTAVITPCGHVFGTELTGRVRLCPVCRSSL
jgi:hypothetical protein